MSETIDLKQFFKLLWKKKIIIIVLTIIAVIVGGIYTLKVKKPKYTATSRVVLIQGTTETITQQDLTINDKIIATYQKILKSESILNPVGQEFNIDVKNLENAIRVSAVQNTQMIEISVTLLNRENAAKIANKLADSLKARVIELYKFDNISILDYADVPEEPSNIQHRKTIFLSGFIGIFLSFGIIFLIYLLDNTIKNQKSVEELLNLPILAELPKLDSKKEKLGGVI